MKPEPDLLLSIFVDCFLTVLLWGLILGMGALVTAAVLIHF